jgi:hypothetical protein
MQETSIAGWVAVPDADGPGLVWTRGMAAPVAESMTRRSASGSSSPIVTRPMASSPNPGPSWNAGISLRPTVTVKGSSVCSVTPRQIGLAPRTCSSMHGHEGDGDDSRDDGDPAFPRPKCQDQGRHAC